MPLSEFTMEEDKKLIKLVEKYPILYNNNNDRFLDAGRRDLVWQEIGEVFKKPASACKRRWIHIRDNMRRKIRERENLADGVGLGIKKQSYKYKYEDDLGFVLPFYKTSLVLAGSSKEPEVEKAPEEFFHNYYSNSTEDMLEDVKPVPNIAVVNRRQEESNNASFASVSTRVERPLDPIAVYLEAVESTLRNLNPFYLNQAKTRIFQVVQDCELQQIVNKGERPPPE